MGDEHIRELKGGEVDEESRNQGRENVGEELGNVGELYQGKCVK